MNSDYIVSNLTFIYHWFFLATIWTKESAWQFDLWPSLSFYPSEVSPVWPGLLGVECEAADHLLTRRVSVGCLQLRPLPASWRRSRCQVPGGGAAPERLRTDLWERRALPGGMTDMDKHKTLIVRCTQWWRIQSLSHTDNSENKCFIKVRFNFNNLS